MKLGSAQSIVLPTPEFATGPDFQPVTLAGVLASLEFASKADPEADYRPTGAIEGLRAIIKRRAP